MTIAMRHGQPVGRDKEMAYLDVQETSSVKGSAVAYTDGVYQVVDGNGFKATAKGVRLRAAGTGGVLAVHLADNPAGVIDYYDIVAGDPKQGIGFDQIIEAGTTVTLDDNFYINT